MNFVLHFQILEKKIKFNFQLQNKYIISNFIDLDKFHKISSGVITIDDSRPTFFF